MCVCVCVFVRVCMCVRVSHRKLTKVLKNYVENAEKLTEQLLKAMKALEYIFKFIVRSRVLFNQYVLSLSLTLSPVSLSLSLSLSHLPTHTLSPTLSLMHARHPISNK